MNVCYCFSTACDCNEVDDWHLRLYSVSRLFFDDVWVIGCNSRVFSGYCIKSISWFIIQSWLWQWFPTPNSAVLGTVQCRGQLLAVQGSHTIADPHCFALSKDVKSCKVIWRNTYPCWFTLAHFSSQLQWFIWCRWNCSESYKPRLGEVSEWFKVIDSKSIVRLCVPGVRIPPSPPHILPCECTGSWSRISFRFW